MSAQIINLPAPDDDTIPVVSGIPLADADPVVIARRGCNKPWEDRAWFFNNILNTGFERTGRMMDYAVTDDDAREFTAWVLLTAHRRIAETLDLWGDEEPSEGPAALLFALSLKPDHRLAARAYFMKMDARTYPSTQFNQIAEEWPVLRIFHNLSELTRPGLDLAWRRGVPEECDARFNAPDRSD